MRLYRLYSCLCPGARSCRACGRRWPEKAPWPLLHHWLALTLLTSILAACVFAMKAYLDREKELTNLRAQLATSTMVIRRQSQGAVQLQASSDAKLAASSKQIALLQAQIAELKDGDLWQEQIQDYLRRTSELTQQLSDMTAERNAARQTAKDALGAQAEMPNRLSDLQLSVSALTQERGNLIGQIENLNTRIAALSTACDEYRIRVATLALDRDDYRNQFTAAALKCAALQVQTNDLTARLANAAKLLDQLRAAISSNASRRLRVAKTYADNGEFELARPKFKEIVEQFSGTQEAAEAEKQIAYWDAQR